MGIIPLVTREIKFFVAIATTAARGCSRLRNTLIILESAIGREKDMQDIDVQGKFEKLVVTLLVISD